MDDQSGGILIGDAYYDYPSETLGNIYTVRGIGNWEFSERKIEPRDINDVDDVTGIDEPSIEFAMYPNPTSGSLTLDNVELGSNYSITDAMGRTVESGVVITPMMNLDHLSTGMYSFTVFTDGGVGTQRFVKQ